MACFFLLAVSGKVIQNWDNDARLLERTSCNQQRLVCLLWLHKEA